MEQLFIGVIAQKLNFTTLESHLPKSSKANTVLVEKMVSLLVVFGIHLSESTC